MLLFRDLRPEDLDIYHAKVGAELTPHEFVGKDDYLELCTKKELFKSWVLYDDTAPAEWIGWCAIGFPTSVHPDTVHLYGGVIFSPYRGLGYSKLLYDHRLAQFPNRDLSTSVCPDRIQSLNIALGYGFKPFAYAKGFINLIRRVA